MFPFNSPNLISFSNFQKIGQESFYQYHNFLIRAFIRQFGPLGVNARIRNGHILNLVQRLNMPANATVLDAGCGLAYSSIWLAKNNPKYSIRAIDIDKKQIQSNQSILKFTDIKNIQFDEQKVEDIADEHEYDLIFSMDVLEHIPEDILAMKVLRRAIKPTGWLLLHLPRRYTEAKRCLPGFKNFRTHDHVRPEYTHEEIREKLLSAGFEPIYQKYTYSWKGELAFELNYLFWQVPALRYITAFLTHPLTTWLAYQEIKQDYEDGNSLILLATPV